MRLAYAIRMTYAPILLMILAFLLWSSCEIQAQNIRVERAGFSTDTYDEYSPVYYEGGLVFCSTRKLGKSLEKSGEMRMANDNIWQIPFSDVDDPGAAFILATELVTSFHDGPVTFSADGQEICYSRNLEVDPGKSDLFDSRNQLGLFMARWVEGSWSDITPFPYNSKEYLITTPAFSADAGRIYFASDMPGGFGGTDLWYSERSAEGWQPPVNLGPGINTGGNESFPSDNGAGILFFASDGLKGMGKKDIFYTSQEKGDWLDPVHLGEGINSPENDFGLVANQDGTKGYFSSNRKNNYDIYHFTSDCPAFCSCDSLRKNFYCYQFSDEGVMEVDSLPLGYMWQFGDGEQIMGMEVEHCFPGPGKYLVEMSIIDNNTGNTFFTQSSFEVLITDEVQPFITSPDAAVRDQEVVFDALLSNLPHMDVDKYFWDFGDGIIVEGERVIHAFEEMGSHRIQLGITSKADTAGIVSRECVYKVVEILEDNQDLAMFRAGQKGLVNRARDSTAMNAEVSHRFYSMEDATTKGAVFRVEVLHSDSRINADSSVFDPLRGEYTIKEIYLRDDSLYSYTVGEASNALGAYDVYSDVVEKGFENASVKSYILAEMDEVVLIQLTSDLANFLDAYFEFDDYSIGKASYSILDQVVDIMVRYPNLYLEIAAHTDNMGSFEYNMELSQRRAQSMVDYLTESGIEASRLIGKGYGESRPIASNSSEEGRMANRRVEFIVLNDK